MASVFAGVARQRCATANTHPSKTASVSSRPPGCATCPSILLTPTPPGWKSSWPQPIWSPGPKLIGFTEHSELACCEIATFHYRVLHVAARITREPDNSGCASMPPGAASAPPSPNTLDPGPGPTTRKTPPALGRPAHRRNTRRPVTPTRQNQLHKPATTDSARPREKSRLGGAKEVIPLGGNSIFLHF
jgi:hypothetical protein